MKSTSVITAERYWFLTPSITLLSTRTHDEVAMPELTGYSVILLSVRFCCRFWKKWLKNRYMYTIYHMLGHPFGVMTQSTSALYFRAPFSSKLQVMVRSEHQFSTFWLVYCQFVVLCHISTIWYNFEVLLS